MNTSEWITRSVAKLLPNASASKKSGTFETVIPEAAERKASATSLATVADKAVPRPGSRSMRERLGADSPQPEEAMSPLLLRNMVAQLQAVIDSQISEVEGGRRAKDFALWYSALTPAERRDCWLLMSDQFAPDPKQVQSALAYYEAMQNTPEEGEAEIRLRRALVSPRTRLLQRFAVFPDGLQFLVKLRSELLPQLKAEQRLLALDAELENLFSTWFDIAFLELRRLSWDSPASLIEKLIHYEAVHDIRGWSDVKNRLDSDRRCYGFFHPQWADEPLIFIEVALLDELPRTITPLLDETAAASDLNKATTAIFYSISNTQSGLRGVSFGDSLIKRVVEILRAEFPRLKTFATLSPIPDFRNWLGKNADAMLNKLNEKARGALAREIGVASVSSATLLTSADLAAELDAKSPLRQFLLQCAAYYLSQALVKGKPPDPVARFHLGNGARIERLNWSGDPSAKGFRQSYGMMVNYLYDLKRLDKYRSQFANSQIAVASDIKGLEF